MIEMTHLIFHDHCHSHGEQFSRQMEVNNLTMSFSLSQSNQRCALPGGANLPMNNYGDLEIQDVRTPPFKASVKAPVSIPSRQRSAPLADKRISFQRLTRIRSAGWRTPFKTGNSHVWQWLPSVLRPV
jgi:hypothetical protein